MNLYHCNCLSNMFGSKQSVLLYQQFSLWNAEMHRKTPVIIKEHQSYQKHPAIDHWYVNNWRFSRMGRIMSAFSVLRLIFIPWQPLQHHGSDEFYQYVKAEECEAKYLATYLFIPSYILLFIYSLLHGFMFSATLIEIIIIKVYMSARHPESHSGLVAERISPW